jgi:hypothetical protein
MACDHVLSRPPGNPFFCGVTFFYAASNLFKLPLQEFNLAKPRKIEKYLMILSDCIR